MPSDLLIPRFGSGSYQKKSGCIRRIDTYLNEIVLQSGDRIPLDEIVDIDGVIAAADEV